LQVLWEEPPRETAIGTLTSLNFRREVWQWAIAGIKEFPFTGSGLGSFRRVVVRLYPINLPPDYDIAHAHNIFFQVALDVGLPGLIAYLALLMLAGTVAWQVARQDEALRPFALGLLAGLAGLHIYGLTDALAPGAKPGLLFWAALGLLAAMRRIQQA
jgi:putative inorganic carbon (HCO3(-)) transporter